MNQIFLFNLNTMAKMQYFHCFTNSIETLGDKLAVQDYLITNNAVLGSRWLAFASNQATTNPALDFSQSNQSFSEIGMDLAKKTASSIYYFGDLGMKKVKNLLNPESTQVTHTYMQVPHAGTVEIRDIATRQLVAHFRSHREPIAAMTFDSSGTLLATASTEGNVINIFKIAPSNGKGATDGKGIRHLYRLYRGVTSAYIRSLEFSINSKWLAVSSSHGTTRM